MTFSDMEMKELGRSTWNDTDNITSLIRTFQVCLRHLTDGRSLHGARVQTHTHNHYIRYQNYFVLSEKYVK